MSPAASFAFRIHPILDQSPLPPGVPPATLKQRCRIMLLETPITKQRLAQASRVSMPRQRYGCFSWPPFEPTIFATRYRLGAGAEQIVFGFPLHCSFRDIVIKEARRALPWRGALLSRLLMPDGGLSNLLTWRDIASIKERDNKVILELLGSLVLPSSYVHGCASDRSGR